MPAPLIQIASFVIQIASFVSACVSCLKTVPIATVAYDCTRCFLEAILLNGRQLSIVELATGGGG